MHVQSEIDNIRKNVKTAESQEETCKKDREDQKRLINIAEIETK